jgi:protein-tyrosine phosphatase
VSTIDLLVVCTGNIARSAMGEALLRHHLEALGVDALVHSAGTLGWPGPPPPPAVEVLRERGLDIGGHESRRLTRDLAEQADVVLGMTRNHLSALQLHGAGRRAFLPAELERLGRAVGPRKEDEPLRDWIMRVDATRDPDKAPGRASDEIGDPVGEPLDVFRATATRLDGSLATIAALVAGIAP